MNERAVPVAAIKQPRPPSSLNHHAGNTTEQYPGEVSHTRRSYHHCQRA
ncbi:MAG: hypothetical protein AAFU54_31055 [Chloroflexota bacterium]